jgi:hypothetical protein
MSSYSVQKYITAVNTTFEDGSRFTITVHSMENMDLVTDYFLLYISQEKYPGLAKTKRAHDICIFCIELPMHSYAVSLILQGKAHQFSLSFIKHHLAPVRLR